MTGESHDWTPHQSWWRPPLEGAGLPCVMARAQEATPTRDETSRDALSRQATLKVTAAEKMQPWATLRLDNMRILELDKTPSRSPSGWPHSTVRLVTTAASADHCVLTRSDDGVLVDDCSANGTVVDGAVVWQGHLKKSSPSCSRSGRRPTTR